MMKWVLIIMLHGWGSGVGSDGNAVATVEFTTQAKCEAAASAVYDSVRNNQTQSRFEAICVEK